MNLRNLISKNAGGRIVLLLFLLSSIIYAMMLTITIPKVVSFSGGMKLLDMIPTGYNAAYVNLLLSALGEQGRHAYLFKQIPLDMIYPALFAVSNCLIIAYILKKLGKSDGSLFYFCFLPLFAGIFDYCENIGIITLLMTFPDVSEMMAQTTNVFSLLKSSFTTAYFLFLIGLLITWGYVSFFGKDKMNPHNA